MIVFAMSLSATTLSQFTGNWKNTNSKSRGITKVKISKSNQQLKMQVFGSCSPRDCDWGSQKVYPYGRSTSSNLQRNILALSATFNTGFSKKILVVKRKGNKLVVQSFTRFTDKSRRSNYMTTETFIEDKLATPKQITPQNNAIFDHFPRKTVLKWSKVIGAKSYGVEIDCLHCCKSGKWCLDVKGKAWKTAKVNTEKYSFTYVGAQSGKWRVWAIDKNGNRSPKSKWRTFKYTK
ncbi:MAG: Unknown protein [uncultured Sulfurovum sp.]|uniref:Uncharacterized protein n=1 Tax=uncultured Sulfurovum sp. TaxID=269237 RepID=A0A6S6TIZ6_9BACT|nr:MAG: Unknown protein [uncultured Sulfurovum sp.]